VFLAPHWSSKRHFTSPVTAASFPWPDTRPINVPLRTLSLPSREKPTTIEATKAGARILEAEMTAAMVLEAVRVLRCGVLSGKRMTLPVSILNPLTF
jgi:hypothetical protein